MSQDRVPSTLQASVAVHTSSINRLETTVFGNGQPGLEAKLSKSIGEVKGELKQHIESVERHARNNIREGDQLLLNELEAERKSREKQHDENTKRMDGYGKRIDRLTLIQASFSGALLMFKILEDIGWIHIGGH